MIVSHFFSFTSLLIFTFFFCCPRHVSRCMCSFKHISLPDWRISTLHLILLNNRNSPLSSQIFSTLLSFPQSFISPPQSSPRYSLFLNLLFLPLSLFLPQSSPLFFLSFIFIFLTFSSLIRSGLLSAFEHPVTIVHATLYALQ